MALLVQLAKVRIGACIIAIRRQRTLVAGHGATPVPAAFKNYAEVVVVIRVVGRLVQRLVELLDRRVQFSQFGTNNAHEGRCGVVLWLFFQQQLKHLPGFSELASLQIPACLGC